MYYKITFNGQRGRRFRWPGDIKSSASVFCRIFGESFFDRQSTNTLNISCQIIRVIQNRDSILVPNHFRRWLTNEVALESEFFSFLYSGIM